MLCYWPRQPYAAAAAAAAAAHLDVVSEVFGEPRVLLFKVVFKQQPCTLAHLQAAAT
jgi:hypothetical protein